MTRLLQRWRLRHAAPLTRLLRSSLLRRTGAVGLATLASKALTLVALGVAARALGPAGWGLVGSALAAVAYASVLLSPGLMGWGTRQIARNRQSLRATLLTVNLAQSVLAGAACLGVAMFGWRYVEDTAARAVLLVSAPALFAQALSVEWVFDGLERPDLQARLQLLVSAGRLAAVLWLCRSPDDTVIYAGILPLFLSLQALAGYALLHRGGWFRVSWPGAWRLRPPRRLGSQPFQALHRASRLWGGQLRASLREAWPLSLTMALFLLAHNANTLIVQVFGGSQAAGHYLAALRFVEMASVLPGVVGAVFRPRLARVAAAGAAAAAREARLYARAHLLTGWLLAPWVFAEAPRIIDWLYGAQYRPAVALLRVFAVAILANYLVCGYTNCLVAFGRDRVLLRAMAVAGVTVVAAGLVLTPLWGAAGAALAASLLHPVGWLLALPEYRRALGPIEWRPWRRPVAAAVGLVALSAMLESLGAAMLWRVAACAVWYLAVAGRSWSELELAAAQLGAGASPVTERCGESAPPTPLWEPRPEVGERQVDVAF